MCECIKTQNVIAGWCCCTCNSYNGLQRAACRGCGRERHKPLSPCKQTGALFETYEEAYADDPDTLARIHEQLRRHATN